jgi:hypothetical protein
MRRFRLRRLWRVNCEALMIASGQNLKRLLKRRGWGRRLCPAEALLAPLIVCFCVMYSSFLTGVDFLFANVLRICLSELSMLPTHMMSFGETFSTLWTVFWDVGR